MRSVRAGSEVTNCMYWVLLPDGIPDRKAGFPDCFAGGWGLGGWGVWGVGLGRGLGGGAGGWAGLGGGGGEGRLCSGDWAVVDVELEIDGLGGSTQAMTKSY